MAVLNFEKLTINEAELFKESLADLLSQTQTVLELDFVMVTRIDMSAIQLLLSLEKSCLQKKIDIHFRGCNKYIHDSFELASCSTLLELIHE